MHLGGESPGPEMRRGDLLVCWCEPVGLVVDDHVLAGVEAEHEIDAPRQVSADVLVEAGVVEPVAVGADGVVRLAVRAEHPGDVLRRHGTARPLSAGDRELEAELVETVRARDITQPRPAGQGSEGGIDRHREPLDEQVRNPDVDRTPGGRVRDRTPELRTEVR